MAGAGSGWGVSLLKHVQYFSGLVRRRLRNFEIGSDRIGSDPRLRGGKGEGKYVLRRSGMGGVREEEVLMICRMVGRGISSWRIRRDGGGVKRGEVGVKVDGRREEFAPGLRRMRFSPVVD